ncbi:MAG: ABC transporter permease [Sedimentisphaerales bacterium]|nr:ABC transporter permease [Sedimentisphaerales bacterium]
MDSDEKNKFLTEYKKAQDSAEHHGNLIWTATGVACAANIALLIFVIRKEGSLNYPITSTLLGVLGISLIGLVWLLANALIELKKRKYDRCKELERVFGFKQHLNESKHYPAGRQRLIYNVCLAIILFIWGCILGLIWGNTNISFLTNSSEGISNQITIAGFSVANVLTFVLIFVTIAYVIVTWRILKANCQAVKVMRDQLEASIRPYIVPSTFLVPGNRMICLRICNTGKAIAEKLQLKLDKDYYPSRENQEEEYNLRNIYAFTEEIKTFSPGAELIFYLGTGNDIFKEDNQRRPRQFTITATYNFLEKPLSEEVVVDLEAYRNSQLHPQEAIVTSLKKIESAISELKKGDF